MSAEPQFVLTNRVANKLLIPVLKGPLGSRLGRRLAVLEYDGRRSGTRHTLVTQYSRDHRTVRIRVGNAQHKRWWRNFAAPHPLHLRLAGRDRDSTAHAVTEGGRVSVVAELSDPPSS